MGSMQRRKGKVGEREAAKELTRVLGIMFRRGQQFSGSNESPDVVGLPGVHLEIKRQERLNLREALEQAIEDAGEGNVPAVLHRSNRTVWLLTLRLEDLPAMVLKLMDEMQ